VLIPCPSSFEEKPPLPLVDRRGFENMPLPKLSAESFEEHIYDNGEPCLVIFVRKDCHVCKGVLPVLEKLQPKYEGKFGFYCVDFEENAILFQRFALKGVPQILYFSGGEFRGRQAGHVEKETIEEKISDSLSG
jgi:thioredoxin 1